MTVRFREAILESGWLKIKPEREDLGLAMAFIRKKKSRMYDLEIKEHREKRSLDANAYAWVLIGELSKVMRIPPNEVYIQAIRDIGGNYEILPARADVADKFKRIWENRGIGWPCDDLGPSKIKGFRNLRCYYGSSVYDTEQMSRLIDNLVQDCNALGIETRSPEELKSMLREWDA